MKLSFQKNNYFLNLFVAGLLLVGNYLLIYSHGPQLLLKSLFVIFLIISLVILVKEIVKKVDSKSLKLILTIQLVSLALLVPGILKAELWGDEIGVIEFAELPFIEISDASSQHAAVPPFDYWMLHTWIKAVDLFDISPYYNEVIFRLPYFLIHSLSSIYFAMLVHFWLKKHRFTDFFFFKTKSIQENALPVIAALFFFFNPLLLFYGLEVRYYSTTILGVLVTLYYFLNKKFNEPSFLFLTLLFSLNSVFNFIFIFPLVLLHLWQSKKIETLVTVGFLGLVFLQIEPRLDYMEVYAITSVESWEKIKLAFFDLHRSFLTSIEHWLSLAFVFYLFLKQKQKRKDVVLIVFYIIYLFLAVAIPSYLKRYFDFHHRHFLVVVPFYSLLFFYPFHIFKQEVYKKFYSLWLMLMILIWVLSTFLINGAYYPHKTNLGAKKMFSNIGYQQSLIVYYEPAIDKQILDFNKFAYEWYRREFGFSSQRVITENQVCQNPCLDAQKCVVITGDYQIDCLTNVHGFYHEETEFSNYYYSPLYFPAK